MSEIDVIREIAKEVLTVPTPAGASDNWLWDKAQRIQRNVEYICRLPELVEANLAIDRFCLIGATYFFDFGFAHYADVQDNSSRTVLAERATSRIIRSNLRAASISRPWVVVEAFWRKYPLVRAIWAARSSVASWLVISRKVCCRGMVRIQKKRCRQWQRSQIGH